MSKLYREQAAYLVRENRNHPPQMVPMDLTETIPPEGCIAAWRSNRFLAQLYAPENGAQRISICRTMIDTDTGRWVDGITWDEIQEVKRQIGFGDRAAVEIYPEQTSIVNVANMRHIWLVDALPFAWRRA